MKKECLEKATELGLNEITPLIAARTDKALVAAAAKRVHSERTDGHTGDPDCERSDAPTRPTAITLTRI